MDNENFKNIKAKALVLIIMFILYLIALPFSTLYINYIIFLSLLYYIMLLVSFFYVIKKSLINNKNLMIISAFISLFIIALKDFFKINSNYFMLSIFILFLGTYFFILKKNNITRL